MLNSTPFHLSPIGQCGHGVDRLASVGGTRIAECSTCGAGYSLATERSSRWPIWQRDAKLDRPPPPPVAVPKSPAKAAPWIIRPVAKVFHHGATVVADLRTQGFYRLRSGDVVQVCATAAGTYMATLVADGRIVKDSKGEDVHYNRGNRPAGAVYVTQASRLDLVESVTK